MTDLTRQVLRAALLAALPLGAGLVLFGLFFDNWLIAGAIVAAEILSIVLLVVLLRRRNNTDT